VYFFYKGLHVDEKNGLGSVIVVEAEMGSDNLKGRLTVTVVKVILDTYLRIRIQNDTQA
jgi:hypothetical protein